MTTSVMIGIVGGFIIFLVFAFVLTKRFCERGDHGFSHGLVSFKYRELKKLTKNFSERIGSGGFSSFFKGSLPDLTLVAVKKL